MDMTTWWYFSVQGLEICSIGPFFAPDGLPKNIILRVKGDVPVLTRPKLYAANYRGASKTLRSVPWRRHAVAGAAVASKKMIHMNPVGLVNVTRRGCNITA